MVRIEAFDWSTESRYLHDESDPVHKLGSGDVLVVHEVIVLSHLPGPPDEQPVVGPHAAVHHADVVSDLLDLVG